MMFPIFTFIYFVLLFSTVFVAELAIKNFEQGGLFHWWEQKVLFPLRLRNSKFAKPLGDCPLCFTTWLGCTVGLIYWILLIVFWFKAYSWLFVTPGIMYLSIGLTAFFKMLTDKK